MFIKCTICSYFHNRFAIHPQICHSSAVLRDDKSEEGKAILHRGRRDTSRREQPPLYSAFIERKQRRKKATMDLTPFV
jgi:hypothetical protein